MFGLKSFHILHILITFLYYLLGNYFNASHMIHIHGHYFRVVARGTNKNMSLEYVQNRDKENGIHRNLHKAVLKDTVNVPYKGFVVLRFHAKNPGKNQICVIPR